VCKTTVPVRRRTERSFVRRDTPTLPLIVELTSRNPATGELLARYSLMSDAELDRVLELAYRAQRRWRSVPLSERCQMLRNIADGLGREHDAAAQLATLEMGKPILQARAELDKCAWACRSIADQASAALEALPIPTEFRSSRVQWEPLGVLLAIMPWNFPYWQIIRAAIPAIVAGNAVVVKPSPEVTGCALLLDAVIQQVLPEGVYNTIRATHEQVAQLITDPRIAGVMLTGSTRAGRIVASRAGNALKKTVLELGGSDAYLVLRDADLDLAVETCVAARMINNGQSCIAAKRFIVDRSICATFEEMVSSRISRYEPADPLDERTLLGPLARRDLAETLIGQARASIERGARVLLDGGIVGNGTFVRPYVLSDVTPGMPAFDEETFGPLAAIIVAETEEDALALANRSSYGLGAAIFTRDLERAERLAGQLEAGSVFVNAQVRSDPRLPFGGIKDSGWGRELSMFGIREFVNVKTVVIG